MSYVNPPWNVFRRDIWLAIDRSGSSRLLYSFSDSLPCVLFHSPFHNTSRISASSSRSNSRSILRPFSLGLRSPSPFLLRCKVSFNWVDIDRCNEKSCRCYSYGRQLRPQCIICRSFFLPPLLWWILCCFLQFSTITLSTLSSSDDLQFVLE